MKKICPICEGSGQLSSFKGVSRFLLSWEECPECGGLGLVPDTKTPKPMTAAGEQPDKVRTSKKSRSDKR